MLSLLLLSPTIRTLLIWPYPILWALCFFIVAVYFYLSFEETLNNTKKIQFAFYNVIFLALASYLALALPLALALALASAFALALALA